MRLAFVSAGASFAMGMSVMMVGAVLADFDLMPKFVPEAGAYMMLGGVTLAVAGCWSSDLFAFMRWSRKSASHSVRR